MRRKPLSTIDRPYESPIQREIQESKQTQHDIIPPQPPTVLNQEAVTKYLNDLEEFKHQIEASETIKNKDEILNNISNQQSVLTEIKEQYDKYESLPEQKKQLDSYLSHIDPRTGEIRWNEIPKKEWKYYPGAEQKFSNFNDDEKILLMNEAYGKEYFQEAYRNQLQQRLTGGPVLVEPDGTVNFSKRLLKKQIYYKNHGLSDEESYKKAIVDTLWEDFTKTDIQEKYIASLGPIERNYIAIQQVGRMIVDSFVGSSVMLPEFLISKGMEAYQTTTGTPKEEAETTVPFLSHVRREYQKFIGKHQGFPGGVSTLMSGGMEYVKTGKLGEGYATGERLYKQYPYTFALATGSELFGIYEGGKAIHTAKSGFNKAFKFVTLKTLGKEYVPYALHPINIARTVKYGIKRRTGTAVYQPPTEVFRTSTLLPEGTHGYSKYGQVPFGQGISEFATSKGAISKSYYTTVHTSPQPPGFLGRVGYAKSRLKIGGSLSESPGMSTSPYGKAVPQFFHLEYGGEVKYRPSVMPNIKIPRISTFLQKDIVRLPKVARSYEASAKIMKEQPKGSYSVVAPKMELGKTGLVEPETIIWKGTNAIKIRQPAVSYTRYKGVTVPETKYLLYESRIKPSWELSKIPGIKHKARSYESYVKSSEEIIREFRRVSRKHATDVYKTSAKFEKQLTGKTIYSDKLYIKAIKDIEKKAKRHELELSEWKKPTVHGQLKLKGFISIEKVKAKQPKKPTPSTEYIEHISIPAETLKASSSKYVYKQSYISYPRYSSPGYSYKSYSSKSSYPSRASYPSKSYKSYKMYYILPPSSGTTYRFKGKAYDVYSNGKKLNKQPLTKQTAKSVGADYTDKTPSTEFTIKETEGPPSQIKRTEWNTISHKFLKNGNKYYEKKKYQSDYDIERRKYVQKAHKRPYKAKTKFLSIIPSGGSK